jgi:hypothetical protein
MFIFTDNASTFVLLEIFRPKREELTKKPSVCLIYKLFWLYIFVRKALIELPIRRHQYNLVIAEGSKSQSGTLDWKKK